MKFKLFMLLSSDKQNKQNVSNRQYLFLYKAWSYHQRNAGDWHFDKYSFSVGKFTSQNVKLFVRVNS